MGLLNHQQLQIIKGVGKTIGDSASAEQDPVVIDLLSSLQGYSLIDWSPNIPSLKSGGVWADSPISPGRLPVAQVNTNVIETITVQLTGATCQLFAAQFGVLESVVRDLRRYYDEFSQIEPVYLKWWAAGAPGPQYALIFNIDMKVTLQDSPTAQAEIVLSIEREEGWRGVRPGGNPKEWTAYKRGEVFNAAYANLTASGQHLFSNTTLINGNEYQTRDTFLNRMVATVPAASIDGDLPALAFLALVTDTATPSLIVARDTRPLTLNSTDSGAASQLRRLDIPAAGGTLGTNAAFVNDTTALAYVPTSATRRRIDVTFATAADTDRMTWVWSDKTLMRGRYAIFARARQYNGAQDDLRYYLKFYHGPSVGDLFHTTPVIKPTLSGTIGSTNFIVDYLGIIELPPEGRSVSQIAGKGLLVSDSSGATDDLLNVRLSASRVAGATAVLAFCDILLIPIDEAALYLVDCNNQTLFVDTTGYFSHGYPVNVLSDRNVSSKDIAYNTELRGQFITLIPKVDNNLHILSFNQTLVSNAVDGNDIYVDIVPRWAGIRDI